MIYLYECPECTHRWEHEQKLADAPPDTCPECKKEILAKRLISGGTTFTLLGSGWGNTGYSDK